MFENILSVACKVNSFQKNYTNMNLLQKILFHLTQLIKYGSIKPDVMNNRGTKILSAR